ncbi:MAG: 30S ribosome-binding factor RbfA [Acidimicrobiales bacterium]|nr:30S ribosome-binding factor RbfA [Acidimicrobiales bacterium]
MASRSHGSAPRYPRSARVNQILREILADQLERMEDVDDRLGMLTITAVDCDADLRHATVFMSSLTEQEAEALSEARVRLQSAISQEVRLKRTPQLRFAPDPAVAAGQRVEDILRGLPHPPVGGLDEPGNL